MDNTTSHSSISYDTQIIKTIPYYKNIHDEILLFVKSISNDCQRWLDTGCGTGTFITEAIKIFPETEFYLADPSKEMLKIAGEKLKDHGSQITLIESGSSEIELADNSMDAITAIQSHHYFNKIEREKAMQNCFRILKPDGIFITFENIHPCDPLSTKLSLNYWKQFQIRSGKSDENASSHIDRFNKEYFPITIFDHLELYKKAGFKSVDIFWKSYLQAGFVCIK
jgi:tRNA (cmo5U34)-methyltransferase